MKRIWRLSVTYTFSQARPETKWFEREEDAKSWYVDRAEEIRAIHFEPVEVPEPDDLVNWLNEQFKIRG